MIKYTQRHCSLALIGFGCFLFEQDEGLIEPWLLELVVLETAAWLPVGDNVYEVGRARKELFASPVYLNAVHATIQGSAQWSIVRADLTKKKSALVKEKMSALVKAGSGSKPTAQEE